jgi:hypothetical protein
MRSSRCCFPQGFLLISFGKVKEHVARMAIRETDNPKKIDILGERAVDGRIRLEGILKRTGCKDVDLIHVACDNVL